MQEPKRSLPFMMILSAFMAFASLSTDIYLPAMPAMQDDLGGAVALTITSFLVGFAIAQLVWGPISDHIGRRIPLAIGALLFFIGSVGCALAPSMEAVIGFRVVQAVGACVGPMLSRAMVRDLYTSNQAAAMLSTLVLIMAAALSKVPDEITGSAAALIGALQYGSGMISSALLAVFSDGTPVAMCCIITGFVLLAAVFAFVAGKFVHA